ncbi:MAG TPA: hypothetical protein VFX30_12190 [bacterium]|nr:hypothetical protein [bacterium]
MWVFDSKGISFVPQKRAEEERPTIVVDDTRRSSFGNAAPRLEIIEPGVNSPLFDNRSPGQALALPSLRVETQATPATLPSAALTFRMVDGRVVVSDDYERTVEEGRKALERLRMASPAEVPGLLATYKKAAEAVLQVHTKGGMNPYATIDAWTDRVHQRGERVLDGVLIGFNMQGLNSLDASYRSGTAVKELIGHFAPVVATEMGLPDAARLGTSGTNTIVTGIPGERAAEFLTKLRDRVISFLKADQAFPDAEMARRIGCERTGQLSFQKWTPGVLGMIGGHARGMIPPRAGNIAVVQTIVETLGTMADRARYAENHPKDVKDGFYAGEVPAAERGRGAEPLLISRARPNADKPFELSEMRRGTVTEGDIQDGRLQRPGHDAGKPMAAERGLSAFFEVPGGDPARLETFLTYAKDKLNEAYDLSLKVERFRDFYRPEAFPNAVEKFLGGREGYLQMIDLKNFYAMKLELGGPNDEAMREIADLIKSAYEKRGFEAIIAKRGDEFYVCFKDVTKQGREVTPQMIEEVNRSLKDSIGRHFEKVVLPQMGKYPGDMAGIYAEKIPYSLENLTRTGPDGNPVEEPGVVVRRSPAGQVEYVVFNGEVYVTERPRNMDGFARTVMEATKAGLGQEIDPRKKLNVVKSFKDIPDARGQRRTNSYVRMTVDPATGEVRPNFLMMPGGGAPKAKDVVRGGLAVDITLSGAMILPANAPGAQRPFIDASMAKVGDSTKAQKSPLGPDYLPSEVVMATPLDSREGIPWEATLSSRGRFYAGAAAFGIPALGLRVFHDGPEALLDGKTYSDLRRDFIAMHYGSQAAGRAGAWVDGALKMRGSFFQGGFGLVGGTVAMTLVSAGRNVTVKDVGVNLGSAVLGLGAARGILKGGQMLLGLSTLAPGGFLRFLGKAAFEAVMIECASALITKTLGWRDRVRLRNDYVAAYRAFDAAVIDACKAGSDAPDRRLRLARVKRAHEVLNKAFHAYQPVLLVHGSDEGKAYLKARLAYDQAVQDQREGEEIRVMTSFGSEVQVTPTPMGDPEGEKEAVEKTRAVLDKAEARLRGTFEGRVIAEGKKPPRFIPFQEGQDADFYDAKIEKDAARLFLQHGHGVNLRLHGLSLSADERIYLASAQ